MCRGGRKELTLITRVTTVLGVQSGCATIASALSDGGFRFQSLPTDYGCGRGCFHSSYFGSLKDFTDKGFCCMTYYACTVGAIYSWENSGYP